MANRANPKSWCAGRAAFQKMIFLFLLIMMTTGWMPTQCSNCHGNLAVAMAILAVAIHFGSCHGNLGVMWAGIDHFVAIHDNQHLGVGVLPSSKTVGQRHPQKSIEDAFCHGNQSNCHGNCQIASQLAASNVINGKIGQTQKTGARDVRRFKK